MHLRWPGGFFHSPSPTVPLGRGLSWAWKVLEHDVLFWVEVTDDMDATSSVHAPEKVHAGARHAGCFLNERDCEVEVRLGWDNTKSWWTPKVVDMHIKLFDADYSDIYADAADNSDGDDVSQEY